MSSMSRASVEVMTRGLPRSKALGNAGLEPTAMMAFSKFTKTWPSVVSTRRVLESWKWPRPDMTVTPRRCASPATPWLSLLMMESFHARSLARSTCGVPKLMP